MVFSLKRPSDEWLPTARLGPPYVSPERPIVVRAPNKSIERTGESAVEPENKIEAYIATKKDQHGASAADAGRGTAVARKALANKVLSLSNDAFKLI